MKIKLPFWTRRSQSGDSSTETNQPQTAETGLPAASLATALPEGRTHVKAVPTDAHLGNQDEQRWIENDGLLRDEGVLFGMSGGNIDAKLGVIEHYYARQIREAVRECDLAGERLTATQQVQKQHLELVV